jgi:hypothetical protein
MAPARPITTKARTQQTARRTASARAASQRASAQQHFPVTLTVVLLVLPAVITLIRVTGAPGGGVLDHALDLTTAPPTLLPHVHQVLYVPLGALIVVAFRLILGLRALGTLSPILLGLALMTTGYARGLVFVSIALVVVALVVRPVLRAHGMPYSARVAGLLSTVALLTLLPLLLLRQVPDLRAAQFAYFPVVALGLVTERFAVALGHDGQTLAIKRTVMTMIEAVVITFIATTGHVLAVLTRHPELLLTQIWCVVVVSRYLNFRLFEGVTGGKR